MRRRGVPLLQRGSNRPLNTDNLIWTLRDNSALIASAAAVLWEEKRFEPDGYILLCPMDVMKSIHAGE